MRFVLTSLGTVCGKGNDGRSTTALLKCNLPYKFGFEFWQFMHRVSGHQSLAYSFQGFAGELPCVDSPGNLSKAFTTYKRALIQIRHDCCKNRIQARRVEQKECLGRKNDRKVYQGSFSRHPEGHLPHLHVPAHVSKSVLRF